MSEAFEQALSVLVDLGAERAMVLEGPPPLRLRAAHGLDSNQPWSEQVSLTLLDQSLGEGAPLLLGDAQVSAFADRLSLALTEIRSVMCVPFWSPSSRIAGLLYADTRSRAGVFTGTSLDSLQLCARRLEQALYGGAITPPTAPTPAPPPIPEKPGPALVSLGLRAPSWPKDRPPAPRPQPPRPQPAPAPVSAAPSGRALTIFFRSLAAMMTAGLTLTRALEVLSLHSEEPAMQAVADSLASRTLSGSTLSSAMASCSLAFTSFDVQLVRLGEKSGSLHLILHDLAHYREKALETGLRLKSALTYPALVLVLCLTLLLVAPPYLLEGQFRLIRESGQTPPAITQVMMMMSDFLRSPLGLPLVAAALVAGVAWLRATWRSRRGRSWLIRRSLAVPGLGRTMTTVATARFSRSLALIYRAGIPLSEGLVLAGLSSDNPLLEEGMPGVVATLQNGASLADSLGAANFFPRSYLQVLAAAEETGKLDELMDWVAQLYEAEVEASVASFLALIEPAIMLGMGILVGIILLATLLPMVSVLQTL